MYKKYILILGLALHYCLAFCQDLPNSPQIRGSASLGTGFFVSNDGLLVTALHVVDDKTKILIRSVNQEGWISAALVASNPAYDLALLRVPVSSKGLYFASWEQVPVGLELFVIGYPLLSKSSHSIRITDGLLNGLGGIGERADLLFQFSAQVQKGNSGGPVLSCDGVVIGVVQSKLDVLKAAQKTNDFYQGVNFALKGSVVESFLSQNHENFARKNLNLRDCKRPYEILNISEGSIVQIMAFKVSPTQ